MFFQTLITCNQGLMNFLNNTCYPMVSECIEFEYHSRLHLSFSPLTSIGSSPLPQSTYFGEVPESIRASDSSSMIDIVQSFYKSTETSKIQTKACDALRQLENERSKLVNIISLNRERKNSILQSIIQTRYIKHEQHQLKNLLRKKLLIEKHVTSLEGIQFNVEMLISNLNQSMIMSTSVKVMKEASDCMATINKDVDSIHDLMDDINESIVQNDEINRIIASRSMLDNDVFSLIDENELKQELELLMSYNNDVENHPSSLYNYAMENNQAEKKYTGAFEPNVSIQEAQQEQKRLRATDITT